MPQLFFIAHAVVLISHLRNHKYKYIWNLTDIDEFYDLEKDPGEKTNRIDCEEYSDIIKDLKSKLKIALKKRSDPFCNGSVEWQLGKG